MDQNRHWIEAVAEATGAAALGTALARSASLLWPDAILLAAAAGLAGLTAGWALLRWVGRGAGASLAFEPAPLELAEDVLLLDDRLELPADSRVVQLFAAETLPEPGELAERIDRWVGGRRVAGTDATAELHAALADIRRSLS